MTGHDIIVVGASAGGVETLSRLVSDLPGDLPAAVFVVLHVGPHWTTALPRILARRTKLPVDHAADGEPVENGRVYVARPDHHLLLERDTVRVTTGPKENGHRPSVDRLFCSSAAAYGPRVVGVVLSGTRDDGTAGLRAIHAGGGLAVVQDPEDALFAGMPQSALDGDAPDFVAPLGEMGNLLSGLARKGLVPGAPPSVKPSYPESHGRLWTAYQALEERAALFQRLAERALSRQSGLTGEHFRAEAAEVSRQAEILRALLWSGVGTEDATESGPAEN